VRKPKSRPMTTLNKRTQKKRGRPPTPGGPGRVIPVRVSESTVAAIDRWARGEGLNSRSEAVRRLLAQALGAGKKKAR
jgi:hypothetical protein